jgi:hypothetical protein
MHSREKSMPLCPAEVDAEAEAWERPMQACEWWICY